MTLTNFNITSILIFLAIIISFSFFAYIFFKKREKLKKKYFLLFSQNKNYYYKYIFLFISLFIILFWIFEIKYWKKEEKTKVNWVDIVFVLDVSKSMNAYDFNKWTYNISRLNFSKSLISNYISKNLNNRYWLVIFAWDAISSSPLTTDYSTFLTFLQNVDYRNLSKQWTNLEKAMLLWVNRLNKSNSDTKRAKVLILLSDWWDKWDKVDFDYINWIVTKDITSFILWIWKTTWARIPIGQDPFWNIRYQKFKWIEVITKLNEANLKKLASTISGKYLKVDNINDLEQVSKEINKLEKKAILLTQWKNKKDFSRFLAMLSLVFFILYLVNLRKR